MLAAYADGGLSPRDRADIRTHLAECERCYDLITEIALAQDDEAVGDTDAEALSPRSTWGSLAGNRRWLATAAAIVLVAGLGARQWWSRSSDRGTAGLVEAVGAQRLIESRLTGGFHYGPLRAPLRSEAAAPADLPLLKVSAELQQAAERQATSGNLHAWGMAQLLLGDADDAVKTLSRAAGLAAGDAKISSDLSAAYLASAAKGHPDDWARARDAAERATAIDPDLVEARYNLALALEGMNLPQQARAAWTEYLARDPGSPWSADARRALARLDGPR